jgi:hypothetical protein
LCGGSRGNRLNRQGSIRNCPHRIVADRDGALACACGRVRNVERSDGILLSAQEAVQHVVRVNVVSHDVPRRVDVLRHGTLDGAGARACGGQRVAEGTPQGHWKILTILSALSLRGLVATMTIEEATDGDIFLSYVEQVLCPALRPGDVVIMDNLSAHKVAGVREHLQNTPPKEETWVGYPRR